MVGHTDGATPGHKYNETCSRRLRRLHVRIAHGIDDARFRRHARRSALRQSYRPSFNRAPPTVSLYYRSIVSDHASRYLDFVEGGWLTLPYLQNEMLPLNGRASGRSSAKPSRCWSAGIKEWSHGKTRSMCPTFITWIARTSRWSSFIGHGARPTKKQSGSTRQARSPPDFENCTV